MGLFDIFKPKQKSSGQFVTEEQYQLNAKKQTEMTPKTMEQLRKINVSEEKELKLEYFFYTNTSEKAESLADELSNRNYEVVHRNSATDLNQFVVTGWTSKMKMENYVVANRTEEMCELGYKFDCDFDGWGTSPDQ